MRKLATSACEGGFHSLTAKLDAEDGRRVSGVGLSFQLQGIPLDLNPLLQLCRSVGVHECTYFRPLAAQSLSRHRDKGVMVESVEPVGRVIRVEPTPDGVEEWVVGIVVDNPFRREARNGWGEILDGVTTLQDSSHIICDLAEHHRRDERQYAYRLEGIEHARTSNSPIYRPVANWSWVDDEPADGISSAWRDAEARSAVIEG